ncbi:hypothetical protein K8R78_05450 [bacterium]|nr:hypothetical protein [bacterium]
MKLGILLTMLALVSMLLLTGCGGSAEEPVAEAAAVEEGGVTATPSDESSAVLRVLAQTEEQNPYWMLYNERLGFELSYRRENWNNADAAGEGTYGVVSMGKKSNSEFLDIRISPVEADASLDGLKEENSEANRQSLEGYEEQQSYETSVDGVAAICIPFTFRSAEARYQGEQYLFISPDQRLFSVAFIAEAGYWSDYQPEAAEILLNNFRFVEPIPQSTR